MKRKTLYILKDICYNVYIKINQEVKTMTKAEILKQIEELKKQIEALPDETEEKIRTLPKAGDRGFY